MKKKILSFIILLLFVGFSFYLGFSSNKVEYFEIPVLLNNEIVSFESEEGDNLSLVNYNGIIYMPVNQTGHHLGYMTTSQENTIHFYKVEEEIKEQEETVPLVGRKVLEGLNANTYDGGIVTDSIFSESEYTLLVLWSATCDKCIVELGVLAEMSDYFSQNNIQLLSMATNIHSIEDNEGMEQVLSVSKNVDFKHYLHFDRVAKNEFYKTALKIPKALLFNKDGYVLKEMSEIPKDLLSVEYFEKEINFVIK